MQVEPLSPPNRAVFKQNPFEPAGSMGSIGLLLLFNEVRNSYFTEGRRNRPGDILLFTLTAKLYSLVGLTSPLLNYYIACGNYYF